MQNVAINNIFGDKFNKHPSKLRIVKFYEYHTPYLQHVEGVPEEDDAHHEGGDLAREADDGARQRPELWRGVA